MDASTITLATTTINNAATTTTNTTTADTTTAKDTTNYLGSLKRRYSLVYRTADGSEVMSFREYCLKNKLSGDKLDAIQKGLSFFIPLVQRIEEDLRSGWYAVTTADQWLKLLNIIARIISLNDKLSYMISLYDSLRDGCDSMPPHMRTNVNRMNEILLICGANLKALCEEAVSELSVADSVGITDYCGVRILTGFLAFESSIHLNKLGIENLVDIKQIYSRGCILGQCEAKESGGKRGDEFRNHFMFNKFLHIIGSKQFQQMCLVNSFAHPVFRPELQYRFLEFYLLNLECKLRTEGEGLFMQYNENFMERLYNAYDRYADIVAKSNMSVENIEILRVAYNSGSQRPCSNVSDDCLRMPGNNTTNSRIRNVTDDISLLIKYPDIYFYCSPMSGDDVDKLLSIARESAYAILENPAKCAIKSLAGKQLWKGIDTVDIHSNPCSSSTLVSNSGSSGFSNGVTDNKLISSSIHCSSNNDSIHSNNSSSDSISSVSSRRNSSSSINIDDNAIDGTIESFMSDAHTPLSECSSSSTNDITTTVITEIARAELRRRNETFDNIYNIVKRKLKKTLLEKFDKDKIKKLWFEAETARMYRDDISTMGPDERKIPTDMEIITNTLSEAMLDRWIQLLQKPSHAVIDEEKNLLDRHLTCMKTAIEEDPDYGMQENDEIRSDSDYGDRNGDSEDKLLSQWLCELIGQTKTGNGHSGKDSENNDKWCRYDESERVHSTDAEANEFLSQIRRNESPDTSSVNNSNDNTESYRVSDRQADGSAVRKVRETKGKRRSRINYEELRRKLRAMAPNYPRVRNVSFCNIDCIWRVKKGNVQAKYSACLYGMEKARALAVNIVMQLNAGLKV